MEYCSWAAQYPNEFIYCYLGVLMAKMFVTIISLLSRVLLDIFSDDGKTGRLNIIGSLIVNRCFFDFPFHLFKKYALFILQLF